MKFSVKYYVILIAGFVLKAGYLFSVKKNRLLFSSDEGQCYSCNPKYIFEKVHKMYGNKFEYVWVLNNPGNMPAQYRSIVKVAKFLSPKHIYYLLTSRIIVTNLGIEPFLPKRKSQTVISTGHGGGSYKHMYMAQHMFSPSEWKYIYRMRKVRGRITDYVISTCKKQTLEHSVDMGIDSDRFLHSGFPRIDRFFNTDANEKNLLLNNFRLRYSIPADNLLVLYAPTFRGTHRYRHPVDSNVCIPPVASALKSRFGKSVTFLYRRHRHSLPGNTLGADVVDVTDYPDMQDLLDVADVLITDYSSSIWDFSITLKPAFLYVPDLEKYSVERGFYTPIDLWPYPYSSTVEGLCRLITDYSDKNGKDRITAHQLEIGSFEKGDAAEKIAELIFNNFYC